MKETYRRRVVQCVVTVGAHDDPSYMDATLIQMAIKCHGVDGDSGFGFGFRDKEFSFRSVYSAEKFRARVNQLPDVEA